MIARLSLSDPLDMSRDGIIQFGEGPRVALTSLHVDGNITLPCTRWISRTPLRFSQP